MSERRNFLKLVAAGPAGAALMPLFAETGAGTLSADVESAAEQVGRLPENFIYTRQRPGVWKGKEGSHVPLIEASKGDDGLTLKVQTKHSMSEPHYIVRHTLVSDCGQVLGAKTFTWKDQAVSSHTFKAALDCKSQNVYVLSYCNLHDLWLAETKLEF